MNKNLSFKYGSYQTIYPDETSTNLEAIDDGTVGFIPFTNDNTGSLIIKLNGTIHNIMPLSSKTEGEILVSNGYDSNAYYVPNSYLTEDFLSIGPPLASSMWYGIESEFIGANYINIVSENEDYEGSGYYPISTLVYKGLVDSTLYLPDFDGNLIGTRKQEIYSNKANLQMTFFHSGNEEKNEINTIKSLYCKTPSERILIDGSYVRMRNLELCLGDNVGYNSSVSKCGARGLITLFDTGDKSTTLKTRDAITSASYNLYFPDFIADDENLSSIPKNIFLAGIRETKTDDDYTLLDIGSSAIPVYVKNSGEIVACAPDNVFSVFSVTDDDAEGPLISLTIADKKRDIIIPSATSTTSGVITTDIQEFSGNKSFQNNITSLNLYPLRPRVGEVGNNITPWQSMTALSYKIIAQKLIDQDDPSSVSYVNAGSFSCGWSGEPPAAAEDYKPTYTKLTLGNNIGKTDNEYDYGNHFGYIELYSDTNKKTSIQAQPGVVENTTFYLPKNKNLCAVGIAPTVLQTETSAHVINLKTSDVGSPAIPVYVKQDGEIVICQGDLGTDSHVWTDIFTDKITFMGEKRTSVDQDGNQVVEAPIGTIISTQDDLTLQTKFNDNLQLELIFSEYGIDLVNTTVPDKPSFMYYHYTDNYGWGVSDSDGKVTFDASSWGVDLSSSSYIQLNSEYASLHLGDESSQQTTAMNSSVPMLLSYINSEDDSVSSSITLGNLEIALDINENAFINIDNTAISLNHESIGLAADDNILFTSNSLTASTTNTILLNASSNNTEDNPLITMMAQGQISLTSTDRITIGATGTTEDSNGDVYVSAKTNINLVAPILKLNGDIVLNSSYSYGYNDPSVKTNAVAGQIYFKIIS